MEQERKYNFKQKYAYYVLLYPLILSHTMPQENLSYVLKAEKMRL